MSSEENRKDPPAQENPPASTATPSNGSDSSAEHYATEWDQPGQTPEPETTYTATVEDQSVYGDPYAEPYTGEPYTGVPSEPALPATSAAEPPPPTTPDSTAAEEGDGDDDGMLRMSFLEHLEELRSRLIWSLAGLAIAFILSLTFSERLWQIVQQPAVSALTALGYKDAYLVFTSPMEAFTIIWIKLPLVTSLFIASPWLLYQVWSFIAPGLYKRERRMAGPFIIISAGLFITGGLFAYFVAFRFGLTFLLGVGQGNARPMVTMTDYFDLFCNVILGVSLVFELPVLVFFLTLLRIASPRFLIANARYAVLGIVILAAVITPTPDVFNLMIFSLPMVLLFFIGVFASYLLVLNREGRRFPWGLVIAITIGVLGLIAGGIYLAITRYGYRLVGEWPYLIR
jgi:sec-independent protein translocase protein TatC